LQYFGGTNFGRTAGGPLVATSYDYDAPIDEYGKLFDNGYTDLSQLKKIPKSMHAPPSKLFHLTSKSIC
jgi:hypothetical protein